MMSKREIMAADVAQRPRLQQEPLLTQLARETGNRVARSAAMRGPACGCQVHHGEARGTCARRRPQGVDRPGIPAALRPDPGDRTATTRSASRRIISSRAGRSASIPGNRRTCRSPRSAEARPLGAEEISVNRRTASSWAAARPPNWAAAWSQPAPRPAIPDSGRRRNKSATHCSVFTSIASPRQIMASVSSSRNVSSD